MEANGGGGGYAIYAIYAIFFGNIVILYLMLSDVKTNNTVKLNLPCLTPRPIVTKASYIS